MVSSSMRNISILTHILFVFSIAFLQFHQSIATPAPPYTAVNNITVDCGASGNSEARDGRPWIGDMGSEFTPIEEHDTKSKTSTAQPQGSVDTVPYMTARLSYSPFTYVFPVTSGQKFVRLYFYPVSYPGFDTSKDFFSLKAGSFTLLKNFSASLLATSLGKDTLSKEFCINVEKDQKLNLTFIPSDPSASSNFYAFINGIEIVSMPDDLYYEPDGEGVPYVGQNSLFYIFHDMALETIIRLNVGGTLISPKEDTAGMYREWSDANYFLSNGAVIPTKPYLNLSYTKIKEYVAPAKVFWSAISMGPNRTKNMISNLTWGLPVDSGFRYLVRLHFCEIDMNISGPGERQFIIYIDNKTAERQADVMIWSEGKDTPVYRDYVVMIQNDRVQGSRTLFIALHPVETPSTYKDAILNGVEVFKLSNPDGNLAGPNPENVTSPPSAQQPASTSGTSNAKKTRYISIGTGVGTFLVLLALGCCAAFLKLRRRNRYGSYYPQSKYSWYCWHDPSKGKSTRTQASSLPEELCRQFSLEEIKTATHNFHEELIVGVGGFGKVYKGFVDEGTMIVAVKRLNPESKQGRREFLTEIEMLSQLRHVHLVSLIGYCNKGGEMILVYDYMSNGTLRDHLYDTEKDPLPWIQRLDICIGAANGLNYLHTGGRHPIIHRDVKTTNILLDENCMAKVSDFGLSKEGLDNTAVSTMVKGTFGYLDPDYARRRQLTEKSDVYSFGVVLLEVLCARKALNPKLEQEEQWNLANWARKCIENGTIGEIIDPNLMGKIASECFKVYVDVARSCVHDQGIQRPTMNDVMEKLSFALQLQKQAEAKKEKVNLDGKDGRHTKVLTFHVSDTTVARQYNDVLSGPVSESDSETWLTTDNTGMTYPSLETDTVRCEDLFTDTSNSKA
ncbi:hypothetical protein I3842_03G082900 [Carya illinoinensis]|uniref:Protein kinase domain-containing protein n=1 Tax=Carya illinoinensis TaxID=32201 RepID=A0A922FJK2_CARIL|nr:hypothetical protein I3842_03G082900 [Carya illinoinensis]